MHICTYTVKMKVRVSQIAGILEKNGFESYTLIITKKGYLFILS